MSILFRLPVLRIVVWASDGHKTYFPADYDVIGTTGTVHDFDVAERVVSHNNSDVTVAGIKDQIAGQGFRP